ncbi:MAG: hypothetical protein AAFP84_04200 [Actinomycetota bacterium]
MAFVNKQGGAEKHESRADAGDPMDFDPMDEAIVKVHYDLSMWNFDQHAELAEALAASSIPHAWDGTELVVPESVEEAADAVFERLEEELGPFPIALEEDAARVEFGLDEWTEADRRTLTDAMVEAEIPHRWEGTTVLVAADAEEAVDDLLDAIEAGELMSADDTASAYARDGVLGELFIAANKLGKDSYDAKSRRALIDLAEDVDADTPPYAFAPATWRQVVSKLDAVVAAVGADAAGESVDADDDGEGPVAVNSKQLAALLRQYV